MVELSEVVIGAIDCLDPQIKKEYRIEVNDISNFNECLRFHAQDSTGCADNIVYFNNFVRYNYAIRNYQQKTGLLADGCCGAKTWEKLLGIN